MQTGVPTPSRDHTSLVVQAGLLLLLLLGVFTVFGETLSGALFPLTNLPPALAGQARSALVGGEATFGAIATRSAPLAPVVARAMSGHSLFAQLRPYNVFDLA